MKPSKFWGDKVDVKAKILAGDPESLSNFRQNRLSQYIDDTNEYTITRLRSAERTRVAHRRLTHLTDSDLRYLAHEIPAGNPPVFPVGEYLGTSNSVEFAYLATLLRDYLGRRDYGPKTTFRICEIGPGYGGLARALTETRGLDTPYGATDYVCVDFEPMQAIQRFYLDAANVKARWVLPGDDLPPAELYINTRSMFEMSLNQIGFYFQQIQDHAPSHFFHMNRDKVEPMRLWPFPDSWRLAWDEPFPMNSKFRMQMWKV